jgi:hypothetical protein
MKRRRAATLAARVRRPVASLTQRLVSVARRGFNRPRCFIKSDKLKSNFLHLSKFSEKSRLSRLLLRSRPRGEIKEAGRDKKKRQKLTGEELSRLYAFACILPGLLSVLEAD